MKIHVIIYKKTFLLDVDFGKIFDKRYIYTI